MTAEAPRRPHRRRDRAGAVSPWPSTSTTWSRPTAPGPRRCGPGSGWPRSASSCSRAAGPDAIGTPDRPRATRCSSTSSCTTSPPPSSQAARVLGSLGRQLPDPARPRWRRRCCGPGSTGFREGAADAGLPEPDRRWPSPCSPATPTRPAHILPKRVRWPPRPAAAASSARPPTCAEARSSRPACSRSCPASGPAGAPATTRPGRPRPSEARRRRRRPAGDRPGRHPGRRPGRPPRPSLVGELARCRRRRLIAVRAGARRPDARVPAMPLPPPLTRRAAPGRTGEGRRGPSGPRRAEGDAQDGRHHPRRALRPGRRTTTIVGQDQGPRRARVAPGVGKVKARRTMEEHRHQRDAAGSGASASSSARRCSSASPRRSRS